MDYKEQIEKEAKKHAQQMWGIYVDDLDTHGTDLTIGEISEKDFISGVNSKISERIKLEFTLKILEELKQESPFPNYVPHQYINNKITELKNSIK